MLGFVPWGCLDGNLADVMKVLQGCCRGSTGSFPVRALYRVDEVFARILEGWKNKVFVTVSGGLGVLGLRSMLHACWFGLQGSVKP